jgi:Right handed beta helix region
MNEYPNRPASPARRLVTEATCLGILEDNDITANAYAAVEITTGGNPTLRRNTIHDGKTNGIIVYSKGLGILEDNDITGAALSMRIRRYGLRTLTADRSYGVSVPAACPPRAGRDPPGAS